MKNLTIKILLFVCPIIIFGYFADVYISDGLKRSSLSMGEVEVWNDIYEGKLNSKCWIRGSSKAWVQFSPSIIEKETGLTTYNLGIDGYKFNIQQLRYEEALKFNPKPSMIIYSVDIFLLEKPQNLYNSSQFLPFMLWNRPMEKAVGSYLGFDIADFIIPFWRYIGKYDEIETGIASHIKTYSPFRYKGYKGIERTWNTDFDEAKKVMSSYQLEIDSTSYLSFEAFIRQSIQDSIFLVLVYAPEHIEGQRFVEGRSKLINLYEGLSEKYQIPFLNYSNDTMCYNKAYYYNSQHLNKLGSEIFTEKLTADMKEYGLLNY